MHEKQSQQPFASPAQTDIYYGSTHDQAVDALNRQKLLEQNEQDKRHFLDGEMFRPPPNEQTIGTTDGQEPRLPEPVNEHRAEVISLGTERNRRRGGIARRIASMLKNNRAA